MDTGAWSAAATEDAVHPDLKMRRYNFVVDTINEEIPAPLPKHSAFALQINGPPKSGKTEALLNLFCQERGKKCYNQKFNRIFLVSESQASTDKDFWGDIPPKRRFKSLNHDTLETIMKAIAGKGRQVAIIFDDVMNDIKDNLKDFCTFIDNRRNLCSSKEKPGGSVSIIVTSQVYNVVPLQVRKVMEYVITFKPMNYQEWESLRTNCGQSYSPDQWRQLYNFVFRQPHDQLLINVREGMLYRNFVPIKLNNDNASDPTAAPIWSELLAVTDDGDDEE